MDDQRVDDLARLFAAGLPRRRLIAGLLAGVATPLATRSGGVAATCKKTGKKCDRNRDCCAHAECPGKKCRCKSGFKDCDRKCYKVENDEKHCGRCNNKCKATEKCCDGDCADRDTDPNNCGACGTACAVNEECVGGDCVVPPGGCAPGADACSESNTGTTFCPDNPECFCMQSTEGATLCGLLMDEGICGQCETSADCASFGADVFCVAGGSTVCCRPDAQNICTRICPTGPPARRRADAERRPGHLA
jgi:hypothetical protein